MSFSNYTVYHILYCSFIESCFEKEKQKQNDTGVTGDIHIPFSTVVPHGSVSSLIAARSFYQLLVLASSGDIEVSQSAADILISRVRATTSIMLHLLFQGSSLSIPSSSRSATSVPPCAPSEPPFPSDASKVRPGKGLRKFRTTDLKEFGELMCHWPFFLFFFVVFVMMYKTETEKYFFSKQIECINKTSSIVYCYSTTVASCTYQIETSENDLFKYKLIRSLRSYNGYLRSFAVLLWSPASASTITASSSSTINEYDNNNNSMRAFWAMFL